MAMLLYNFLLSEYYDFGPVWDETIRAFRNAVTMTPVLGNFGIERIAGYITAVENYAIRLDVPDYVIRNNIGYSLNVEGTPITARQAGTGAGTIVATFDVEIMYGTFRGATLNTAGTAVMTPAAVVPGRPIRTTFDALGIEKPADVRELQLMLGRKVSVFRHAESIAAARGQSIPASVLVGTIAQVDNANNSSTFRTQARAGSEGYRIRPVEVRDVQDLTLGTGVEGETLMFNQRGDLDRKDLSLRYNLYAFTYHGFLVSDDGSRFNSRDYEEWDNRAVGSPTAIMGQRFIDNVLSHGNLQNVPGDTKFRAYDAAGRGVVNAELAHSRLQLSERSIERELAKFAAAEDSHYELYFVDNGLTSTGAREFFYVFIPYGVGRADNATPSWTGAIDLRATGRGDHNFRANRPAADGQPDRVHGNEGMTIARDDAFLYTWSGNEFRDLVIKEKLTQSLETVNSVVGTEIRFTRTGSVPLNITFANTGSLAIGAWQGSDTGLTLGRQYRLYTDSNDNALLMSDRGTEREVGVGGAWSYGFVTTSGTTAWVSGRVVNVYRVFDATTGRLIDVLGSTDTPIHAVGAFIGYRGGDIKETIEIVAPNLSPAGRFGGIAAGRVGTFTSLSDNAGMTALNRGGGDTRYGVFTNVAQESPITTPHSPNNFIDRISSVLNIGTAANAITGRASPTNLTHVDGLSGARERAIIGANTRIIAYSTTTGQAASFGRNTIPTGMVTLGIGFITHIGNVNADAVRTAEVMFMYVEGEIATAGDIARYATILGQPGTTAVPSGYTVRFAQIYGTGEIVQVFADNADMMTPGTVVTLGSAEANGLFRASWIGAATGSTGVVNDRIGSTLLSRRMDGTTPVLVGSGSRNGANDVRRAIQHALYSDAVGGGGTAPTVTAALDAFRTALAASQTQLETINASLSSIIGPAYASPTALPISGFAVTAAIEAFIGDTGYGNNVTWVADILTGTGNVLTTFNTWINAMRGTATGAGATGTPRGWIDGASTNTLVGAVSGYVAGQGMFVGTTADNNVPGTGNWVRLTPEMTNFRTIFVRGRDVTGTTHVAATLSDPRTWTGDNILVGSLGVQGGGLQVDQDIFFNETWSPFWSNDGGNDRVGNAWAVVTTDKEGTVLAATFIIVGAELGRDFYTPGRNTNMRWRD
jgi:hypothetical protein